VLEVAWHLAFTQSNGQDYDSSPAYFPGHRFFQFIPDPGRTDRVRGYDGDDKVNMIDRFGYLHDERISDKDLSIVEPHAYSVVFERLG
jgi:hypothetical protein